MSCNGCRILRKGCGVNCVLRPCLEWIKSPEAQSHATLFLSKFFGRSDLLNFISAVPSIHQCTALFQSLLYEAVGRTINPVNGAMGLLSTGNWHLCEAGIKSVLDGGSVAPCDDGIVIPEVDESSDAFKTRGTWAMTRIGNQTDASNTNIVPQENVMMGDDNELGMSSRRNDGEEPKLLNLFQ